KRLEALRNLEEEASKTKATTVAASQPAPVRGNVLSAGSSLTGLAKLENDSYLTDLDEHVKQHWHLPNFLANAGFSATVALFIDERGAVIKKELVKSSGNPIYDQTVLAAIEKSAPFPAPPAKLVNIFAVDGVRLGFPD
ncbi:MAG: TonB C-terminal domain-containing protein, partial [Bdellovibrionaceae bacterium]|nr:TonB C-terminal domain-containing protein [Pseudobdellovibrionaceae bacterium]